MQRFVLLFVMFLGACSLSNGLQKPLDDSTPSAAHGPDASFDLWLDAEYRAGLDFSPLAKTRQGIKSDYGELDDVSEAALKRQLNWRRNSVAQMRANFERNQLSAERQLSWDLWEYLLERAESTRKFQRHSYIFGRNGPHARLASALINYHRVDSIEDMQAYVSRLNQSARYYHQFVERAQLAARDGIRAPYFDYDRTLSEIKRLTSGQPFSNSPNDKDSALWADITSKIQGLVDKQLATTAEAWALTNSA